MKGPAENIACYSNFHFILKSKYQVHERVFCSVLLLEIDLSYVGK